MTVSLGVLLLESGVALAQERAIPFWPDEVPYSYDHLSEVLGPGVRTAAALSERSTATVLASETLNLVDGKRTVLDIRDVLTGRYEPVSVQEIVEYLELLGRAKVISWR